MKLQKIELKNFRCFTKDTFDFSSDIVIIYGNNGSGKTTILESLHYLCYLSSFRSRLPSEITQFEADNFFIKGTILQDDNQTIDIQVGFSKKQKIAKVGSNPISSYKELFPYYQVVTLTIDDLALIQESPTVRRNFIDHAILLANPEYIDILKRYKQILQQRNALLQQQFSFESYKIWTEQLWQASNIIQKERVHALDRLHTTVLKLLHTFFDANYTLDITYNYKNMLSDESFEQFLERKKGLITYEQMLQRSDFGAHLDDFTIQFCNKKLKSFGSRGQQKLLALLIKVAQILNLQEKGQNPIFLLDDFITDFDAQRLGSILKLLQTLKCQLIISSPIREKLLEELLSHANISTIELQGA